MLAVTASGGQDGKLNKLRGAGYVVKCDHPSVTAGAWPAEALAITEAGRTALAKHRTEIAEKKGQHRSGDKRVVFRRDGERYVVFSGTIGSGLYAAQITVLGTTSTRQWRIPVTRGLEIEPVNYCAAVTSAWFAMARSEGHTQCQSTSRRRRARRARAPTRSATPTDSTLLICTYSQFLATTGLP
jgi:hypothetical protein